MSDTMQAPRQLFVGGEWRDAGDGRLLEVVNPATAEVVASVPHAAAADIDDAVAAAAEGYDAWGGVDPWQRSALLRRVGVWLADHVEPIAQTITEEQGKPLAEARGEAQLSAAYFDWFADEARRRYGRTIPTVDPRCRLHTARHPIGPVAAMTPWNFPIVLAARKVAAAAAAGCSVVLKPAEETPRSALFLARAFEAAGLPPGLLNVVFGDPAEISARLIASEVIRKVTFTGSVPVGRHLARLAGERVKPITVELGGHAPVLVLEDADLDAAVAACATAKFRNAGQVCVAPSRFFVHRSVADEFSRRFVAHVRGLQVGDGREPGTDVGPLANERRLAAMEELVGDALAAGATLACGGGRPAGLDRGWFFEPTVLTDLGLDTRVMVEEPFGPVAPVVPFDSLDDAIATVNQSPYGLAGYVFTTSLRHAYQVSERLEVGMVGVNNLVITRPEAPFGGMKDSGYGYEGGTEGIDAFSRTTYVNLTLE